MTSSKPYFIFIILLAATISTLLPSFMLLPNILGQEDDGGDENGGDENDSISNFIDRSNQVMNNQDKFDQDRLLV